jgi:hypothetical protein
VLFITPSATCSPIPGIYTFMGYLMLFHEIGLDYTCPPMPPKAVTSVRSPLAYMMKKLNAKMYAEAERLGSKWILGGECGHMWRVVHQYMETMNGPTPISCMETPKSPITGTVFHNARRPPRWCTSPSSRPT